MPNTTTDLDLAIPVSTRQMLAAIRVLRPDADLPDPICMSQTAIAKLDQVAQVVYDVVTIDSNRGSTCRFTKRTLRSALLAVLDPGRHPFLRLCTVPSPRPPPNATAAPRRPSSSGPQHRRTGRTSS